MSRVQNYLNFRTKLKKIFDVTDLLLEQWFWSSQLVSLLHPPCHQHSSWTNWINFAFQNQCRLTLETSQSPLELSSSPPTDPRDAVSGLTEPLPWFTLQQQSNIISGYVCPHWHKMIQDVWPRQHWSHSLLGSQESSREQQRVLRCSSLDIVNNCRLLPELSTPTWYSLIIFSHFLNLVVYWLIQDFSMSLENK